MMSLTCPESSSAATRGIRSLPNVVDGPNTWVDPAASSAAAGAITAASACSKADESTRTTSLTPWSRAASAATASMPLPKTKTRMVGEGSVAAQLTHFAVAAFSRRPSCSAMMKMLLIR
jgi:hypothetical protein